MILIFLTSKILNVSSVKRMETLCRITNNQILNPI